MASAFAAEAWEIEEPEWTVGDRLRKARHFRGIKAAKDMAALLSVHFDQPISRATVNHWESGAHQPGRNQIRLTDVVRAYAEILVIAEGYFWKRSTCFSPNVHVRALPEPEGTEQLEMYDLELTPYEFGRPPLVPV